MFFENGEYKGHVVAFMTHWSAGLGMVYYIDHTKRGWSAPLWSSLWPFEGNEVVCPD
jgi:hypothetical protein